MNIQLNQPPFIFSVPAELLSLFSAVAGGVTTPELFLFYLRKARRKWWLAVVTKFSPHATKLPIADFGPLPQLPYFSN